MRTHAVWMPPGFGAWAETALDPPADLIRFAPSLVFLILDRRHGEVAEETVARARASLRAALPGVPVIDLDPADLADEEAQPFYDEKMWQYAAMPFSLAGLNALAREINRLVAARAEPSTRKFLALDLDETLWDGVIGEEGPAGIVPRTSFQRALIRLRDEGVPLVILSRNTAEEVSAVWRDVRMALKEDDFVAARINWREKAENLAEVAAALNVHPEAFVFVDDNPAERARMRAAQPAVAVPEFPIGDDERFVRRLRRLYFPFVGLTAEDREKARAYRAEAARQTLARTRPLDAYLAELSLWTKIALAGGDDAVRLAQLSQKSNQFNVCTNRYTPEAIERKLADPHLLWLTVRAGDRFGDQGLVAYLVVRLPDAAGEPADLIDFVMSCRAMNRRLEYAAFNALVRRLRAKGITRLRASYRPTPRNAPVADLFPRLGCEETERDEAGVRYELTIDRFTDAPHPYAVTERE